MSVTLMLSLILLALMIIIGGMKGIGAFVSLWINFAIMVVMIMLINFSLMPWPSYWWAARFY